MKRRPSSAYTLIELLVAMTISVILLALILRILSSALDTWHSTGRYRHQHQAARIMFETIESDLLATMIRPGLPSDDMQDVPWLKVENVPLLGSPSSRLSLIAPIPDQSPGWKGDVCAVHYGLAARDTREGRNVMLFRDLRDPAATFSSADWGAAWPEAETARPSSAVAANFGRFQIALEVRGEDGATRIIGAEENPVVSHDGNVTWDESGSAHRLLAVHVSAELLGLTGVNFLIEGGYDAVPEQEKRPFFLRVPLADGR